LIEQQHPGDRTSVLDQVAVQGQRRDDAVAHPVLAAANVLVQPHRAVPIAAVNATGSSWTPLAD
jgi:hypothetical protein